MRALARRLLRIVRRDKDEEEVAGGIAIGWVLASVLAAGAASAAITVVATEAPTFHPSFPISAKAVAFIERHEGVRYYAYNDPSGIAACTIGAGHVLDWRYCTRAQLTSRISAAQVADYLRADTNTARGCITRAITAHIGQPEYEALVDLVFNAGCGSLTYRDVGGLVNAGETARLPAAWENTATTAGGRYLAGLAQRRIDEVTLALHGYYGAGIGYFVNPKPLTKVEKAELVLRRKSGYYAWLAWYLHRG